MSGLRPSSIVLACAMAGALACSGTAERRVVTPTRVEEPEAGGGGGQGELLVDADEDSSMVLIDQHGRIGFETNVRVEMVNLPGTSGRAAHGMGRVVKSRMNEIRGCYDRAVALDPEVEGSLELVLSTDARGRPSAEVARGDLTGGRISECVTGLLRRLPRAGLPTDARIQLVFVASNTIAAGSREVRHHLEQQEPRPAEAP